MSLINTQLTDRHVARNIGRMLFNQYNQNNSEFSQQNLSNFFQDTYSALNQTRKPKQDDLKGLKNILDKNHDQKVTVEDFEELAIEILTYGSLQNTDNYNSDLYMSTNQTISTYSPKYNSSEKYSQNENYRNAIQTYNQSPINDGIENEQYQESVEYGPNGEKIITKKKVIEKVHTTQQSTIITSQRQQPQLSYDEDNMSEEMQKKLKKAKQMFDRFANEDGVITEEEIEPLIIGTQQSMGITNYQPTEEEIQDWLREVDQNQDGEISWDEYKFVIINSINKSSKF